MGHAMKRVITGTLCATMLVGCAQRADEIAPSYVSPLAYESYTCQQIFEESKRVSARAASVAGVQDSQASNDAVAMGVGLVVFWPALFFIGGQDQSAELARLKGEKDALEQAAIRKNCGIDFRPAPA